MLKQTFLSLTFSSMISSLLLAGGQMVALAAPQHPRPPQAAFDACSGKSEGTACTVTMGEREISGTCASTPEGSLACRPEHPPGPPPEATEACSGKSDGDACTMTHGDRSEDGVCRQGRAGALLCLP